jgi:hypothetical protein
VLGCVEGRGRDGDHADLRRNEAVLVQSRDRGCSIIALTQKRNDDTVLATYIEEDLSL